MERRAWFPHVHALPLGFLLLLMQSLWPAAAQISEGLPVLYHFDPEMVNRSVDPCVDFYRFACAKWMAANPVPPNESLWNTRSNLQLWNWTIVRQAMEHAARPDSHRNPIEQKIGDYWYACMNEQDAEAKGIQPINEELRFIDSLTNKRQLSEAVARLHLELPGVTAAGVNQTAAVLFGLARGQDFKNPSLVVAAWDQGGLGMPSREFYLQNDTRSSAIFKQYVAHVSRMFQLAGEDGKRSAADADVVLTIETALASGQMDAPHRRNFQDLYHPMSLADLKALTPSFDFDRYLSLIGATDSSHNVVYTPDFFRVVGGLIDSQPLKHWKTYLKWWVLHANADYLPKAFVEESFNFYGRTLTGSQELLPRWQRCVQNADRDLGQAIGKAYIEQAFTQASKHRLEAMVRSIRLALARDIRQIDWMSESTKKEALTKLDAMEEQIAYPEKWRDYSALEISRDTYLGNVRRAAAFEFHRQLAMVGRPLDRTDWYITPQIVDASAYPLLNTIAFPAGVLQPPLFDPAQDEAVNYGAIGMVIGHEITHLFDNRGRQFDAQGRLRDWWTTADANQYEARGQCFVSEYTHEVPELGVKTNGSFTEAEDIADNGGLRLALMALKDTYEKQGKALNQKGPDGWTVLQRFFLADAFDWCETVRPEMARTWVLTNGHSLPQFRANDVLANFPEFREAFGCAPGKPMVRQNACRVW